MISSDNSELNDIVDVILINKKYNKTYNSKITIETGKLYIEILPTIFEQNEVSDWKMLYKKKNETTYYPFILKNKSIDFHKKSSIKVNQNQYLISFNIEENEAVFVTLYPKSLLSLETIASDKKQLTLYFKNIAQNQKKYTHLLLRNRKTKSVLKFKFSKDELAVNIKFDKKNFLKSDTIWDMFLSYLNEENKKEIEKVSYYNKDNRIETIHTHNEKSNNQNYTINTLLRDGNCVALKIDNDVKVLLETISNKDNQLSIRFNKKSIKDNIKSIIFKNIKKDKEYIFELCNQEEFAFDIELNSELLSMFSKGIWDIFAECYTEQNDVYQVRIQSSIKQSEKVNIYDENNFFDIYALSSEEDNALISIQDISQNSVICKGVTVGNKLNLLLETDYFFDEPTNVIIKHRKTDIQISLTLNRINPYLYYAYLDLEEKNPFKALGIWDIYYELTTPNEEHRYERVKFKTKRVYKILSDNLFFPNQNIVDFTAYSTVDDELSLKVSESKMVVSNVNFEQNVLNVSGTINNRLFSRHSPEITTKMQLLNEDKVIIEQELKDCSFQDNVCYFNMKLNTDLIPVTENLIDTILEPRLVFNIGNYSYYQNITNVEEDYISSKYLIYPNFIFQQNGSKYSMHPRFYRNTLTLKLSYLGKVKLIAATKNTIKVEINELEHKKIDEAFLIIKKDNDEELRLTETASEFSIEQNNQFILKVKAKVTGDELEDFQNGLYPVICCVVSNNHKRYIPIDFTDDQLAKDIPIRKKLNINKNPYSLCYKRRSRELKVELIKQAYKPNLFYLIRFYLAFILAKLVIRRKRYWIVGENLGYSAQDNGYFFFKAAKEKKVKEKTYFVYRDEFLEKNSLNKEKGMIKYDSFKHFFVYFKSDFLIVSHGVRDVLPTIYHDTTKNKKKIIHLQHGIVAMKKVFFHKNSYNGKVRKMVVSSDFEKQIFIEKMKMSPQQIMNSGLVRYDYLNDESQNQEKKIIFVMPTWREWIIKDEETFLQSDFYKSYSELLNDKELNDYLKENNLVIKIVPHIEIRLKYMKYFSSKYDYIQVIDTEKETVQELIKKSSLLITDYSSVALDFVYLNKPVLFYHFDLEDYLINRGSFVNLYTDLFGPVAYQYDDLKIKIKEIQNENFITKEEYIRKSSRHFDHKDKNNFKRTYKRIRKFNPKG
ncbi:CDP-glycerol glycerophosphotransferase family protein [Carnobacterium sp. FSL W8-0810]|uniref:CDP-glycerol glycerophosphotransferase family protein n=1 Tax=Carnobacterium sp. FSL W8-0810 TaxID=2954705 RepID=UPI0030F98073